MPTNRVTHSPTAAQHTWKSPPHSKHPASPVPSLHPQPLGRARCSAPCIPCPYKQPMDTVSQDSLTDAAALERPWGQLWPPTTCPSCPQR